MKSLARGLALAALQMALVGALGAKLLADRRTQPRFWLRTVPFDPSDPLRGRYVALSVEVPAARDPRVPPAQFASRLQRGEWLSSVRVEPGPLAVEDPAGAGRFSGHLRFDGQGKPVVRLNDPVAYFIPEHVPDPSIRPAGEELWVEVTLPKAGPLRPIRLGVRRGGVLTPLSL